MSPSPPSQETLAGLSSRAREVLSLLEERGARFLPDIARETGKLASQVEDALWELVAQGLVTGDGMAGLRVLLKPKENRGRHRCLRVVKDSRGDLRWLPMGRWDLWRRHGTAQKGDREATAARIARQLLSRYGVVVRELLAREPLCPPWRLLLGIYRRMEARGEIRGGRFVAGFVGEQFALPEAVEALRTVRRQQGAEEIAMVSAADPLNLCGILTPGPRISPLSHQVIVYRDGLPVDVGELGAVRHRLFIAKQQVPRSHNAKTLP
jgi:ATP-dependent Lhr-like helicase